MKISMWLVLLVLIVVLAMPVMTFAGGVVIPGGIGNAVNKSAGGTTGLEDGFVFLNPAMLGWQEDDLFQFGLEGMWTDFRLNANHSAETFYLPGFGLAIPISDWLLFGERLVFGFGVWAPYGLGTRWCGEPEMHSFIGLTRFAPAIAWKPNNNLTLGGSFNLDYGEVKLKAPVVNPDMGIIGSSDTTADGWGVSSTIGAQAKFDYFDLATSYTWSTHVKMHGHSELNSAMPKIVSDDDDGIWLTINYPARLNLSTAIRPLGNDCWTVAFDANYYDANQNQLDFQYRRWENQSQRVDMKDIWVFHTGMEVRPIDKLALRCGWAYMPASIPRHTRSPLLFDVGGSSYSAGIGWQATDQLSIDAAYAYVYAGVDHTKEADYSAKLYMAVVSFNYKF